MDRSYFYSILRIIYEPAIWFVIKNTQAHNKTININYGFLFSQEKRKLVNAKEKKKKIL